MKKSMEKMSSEKSSSNVDLLFSFKRYFINNLDSYQGEYILKEVSKVLEKNVESTKQSSQTMVAEDMDFLPLSPSEQPYEIIGTVVDAKVKSLDNVARIVSKSECLSQMLTCGTVILDISYDREETIIALDYMKLLKELLEKQTPLNIIDVDNDGGAGESKKRYLILISTVMTWAVTKPLDADAAEMPFIETDFRKRKPHPNYKIFYDVENEVIGIARKYKSQIGAIVIGTGVSYGGREDVLFFWFQKAWECEHLLPLFGRGSNVIPLINVQDLAQIVYNLIMDFPKKLYILAVEQNITKQREIVKPLGRIVGSGMFKCIPAEDAFLIPEINQRIFDLMTLNLNLEPTFIVETMGLQWTSELTFAENVPILMKQFKKERGLKPFKVVVYGPPIVGKTTLSKLICEAYGLVYISPETVVEDLLEDLTWRINHWEVGETAALPTTTGEEDQSVAADTEDDGEEEGVQETAKQTLALLRSGRTFNDEEILAYLHQKLLSREALNRGWVLDGFPTTLAQCSTLFEKGDEQDSETGEENEEEPFDEDVDLYSNVLKKILPDIVVSLEATDDFICEKAMRQPEGDSRLDEEAVLKHLGEFRAGDARDITPLNFFDELDIHPLVVPVKEHTDYGMSGTYAAVSLRMGRPCRYGKLLAQIEAAEKKEKKELETLRVKEAKAMADLEKKMKEEREEKMEYWSELYALMREEEEAALAAAGEPVRNYLVTHIFPTLTAALLEVAKLRPDDPIDFLAEYLFKLNPSGKMLEPGYNLKAERLLGKIKILDDALKDLDIKIEPLMPLEVGFDSTSKKDINRMSAFKVMSSIDHHVTTTKSLIRNNMKVHPQAQSKYHPRGIRDRSKWVSEPQKRNSEPKDGPFSLLATSLRHQTTEFFNNSTLHGVRYIAEKERPFCEKFMWFSFTAIGAVATCIIIVSLWEKFQTNPTITGLDTDFHNWDVPFPAVTICDVAPVDEELLQEYVEKQWGSEPPANASDMLRWLATLSYKTIASQVSQFANNPELVGRSEVDALEPAIKTKEAVFNIVRHCEAIFYDCEWKGDSEECCDLLVPVFTEMGFCYAFNSRHSEKTWPWQTQTDQFSELFIHETDAKWSFMFYSSRNDTIIDIYIHSTEEMAGLEQSAQHSWDRRVEKVSFSVKHTYTTEDARQLSIRQRRCIFADEQRLETSNIYTYSACMRQCRMQRCRSFCKCVPHFYPIINGYRHCTVKELECIARYASAITDVTHCSCELGCSHTVYEVEKLTEIDTSKGPTSTPSLESEFVSWPMVRYKREVLFGWVDLLVSFGGIAGLFLGFSLLSGVELIYYFTLRACCSAVRDARYLRQERDKRLQTHKPPHNLSLVPWFKEPPVSVSERVLRVQVKVQPPQYSPPPHYTQYLP